MHEDLDNLAGDHDLFGARARQDPSVNAIVQGGTRQHGYRFTKCAMGGVRPARTLLQLSDSSALRKVPLEQVRNSIDLSFS